MLKIPVAFQRTSIASAAHVWFAERPDPADSMRLVRYFHCHAIDEIKGFTRTPKYTKLLDLQRTDDAIQKEFQKSTQYEVRRAMKEDLVFSQVQHIEAFRTFYEMFAATKNQGAIFPTTLCAYWPNLIVTQMTRGTESLVMHGYIVDRTLSRANLWRSASLFRGFEGEDAQQLRQLSGRANRLLHFLDMRWLRDQGFKTYDFGGYAHNTSNPDLARINEFKDCFGGELVEESDYTSAATMFLGRIKSTFARTAPDYSGPGRRIERESVLRCPFGCLFSYRPRR